MALIEKIHPIIKEDISYILKFQSEYKKELESRKTYALNDPIDVSIIPRVITKEEHKKISSATESLAKSAFLYLSDCLENKDNALDSELNMMLNRFNDNELNYSKSHFSGNGRFDFVKQGELYKLLEMNMVNVSALAYGHQPMATLLDMFPRLNQNFYYLYPPDAMKRRLNSLDINSMLILTKSKSHKDYSDCALNDWELISERLKPIDSIIVNEDNFDNLKFIQKDLYYNGKKQDAVYLRHLDSIEGLENYYGLAKKLLDSNAFIFDNFLTMYLEDKDLTITTKYNPENNLFIPKHYSITDLLKTSREIFPNFVLKIKDMHSGKGVYIGPKRDDLKTSKKAIVQERCFPNLFPVYSIQGLEGDAVSDIAAFISYDYDAKNRKMNSFEISGYLSRFTFSNNKTNICQGGGMIPVLLEK